MKKYVCIFLLILVVELTIALIKTNDLGQINKLFYNQKTGKFITGKLEKIDKSLNSTSSILQQYSFQGATCNCNELVCSCCISLNLGAILKNQNMCTNITLLPSEFSVEIGISFNGKTFVTKIPANNPPSACIPVPYIPVLNVCLRLKDLHFQNSTFHACLDLETKLTQFSILVLHFDCINIGANGIATSKPKINNSTNSENGKNFSPLEIDIPSNYSLQLN